jgi:hypothetical protein
MRRLSTWSELEMQAAAVRAATRVLDLLAGFSASEPAAPTAAGVEAYRAALHGLLEQLARQERCVEELADELRLREHWRDRRLQ